MKKSAKTNYFVAAAGVVAALVLLVAFDLASVGIAAKGERDRLARETAAVWVEQNHSLIFKSAQSALFGTGVWLKGLPADSYVLREVVPGKQDHTLSSLFAIEHDKVEGGLAVDVDMRTSTVAGVAPNVSRVALIDIAPIGKQGGGEEPVFSGGAFARGRVGYYLTAFSSLIWHLLAAGMLFGTVRFVLRRVGVGHGSGPAVVASVALSVALIAAASRLAPQWLAGSAAMVVLFIAWKMATPRAQASPPVS